MALCNSWHCCGPTTPQPPFNTDLIVSSAAVAVMLVLIIGAAFYG